MYGHEIDQALSRWQLSADSINLPKIPYPISTPARLQIVDEVLSYPPSVISIGNQLRGMEFSGSRSAYIARTLGTVGFQDVELKRAAKRGENFDDAWKELAALSGARQIYQELPVDWKKNLPVFGALREILAEIVQVRKAWDRIGGQPTAEELELIRDHLKRILVYDGTDPDVTSLIPETYHQIGQRIELTSFMSALLQLFSAIETALPELAQADSNIESMEWQTPLGLVRISGAGSDRHEGGFLVLVDLGGDDTYVNVGTDPKPGNVSVVIDMDGNDRVTWRDLPGPGSGLFGFGVWLDLEGDDSYTGGNMGLGAALFGGGIFWDEAGNDSYEAGTLSQGVGQYGVGIFADVQGDDSYKADMRGQGFGGPGGVGFLIDVAGNDRYNCGGRFPDPVKARARRHQGKHFLSLCQGYATGVRPDVSGGLGLLFDQGGNDGYEADIFAQGAAYWFGLGMLVDSSGDDRYEAYEHVQGEGLHLGAGFLGDWSGNDNYVAYEHAQGVGVDRASGILYDESGDDIYRSNHESQGTGVKPHGVGILIDRRGADSYETLRDSQGYAKPDPAFPDEQWPIGILLDLEGQDSVKQPYTDAVGGEGRIQNKQGLMIDR
jgi:hypothetical protein